MDGQMDVWMDVQTDRQMDKRNWKSITYIFSVYNK